MSTPLLRPLAHTARAARSARPSASPLAALPAAAAAAAARRSILTGAADARAAPRPSAGGVDTRIFDGVPGFLGPAEFARLQEWQAGLWTRLQDEVRNNPRLAPAKQKWDTDRFDVTDLLALTARDPALTLAFNYAALLLNNSYFLEGIKHDGVESVPAEFADLTEKVEAYAEGTFGGAWLWLVQATGDSSSSSYDVIPTYAAGTLLVASRAQKGRDSTLPLYATPADTGAAAPAGSESADAAAAAGPAPGPARAAKAERVAAAGVKPLAVLNLHESAYLGDAYGVWDRRRYARDWWSRLDWAKVKDRSARSA